MDAELTGEQRDARRSRIHLIAAAARGALLEGTTASGKTSVYAAAIRAALEQGRGALVLVPEIALAVPLLDRLRHDLGVDVALLHSALGDGERADEWRRIRAGEVDVVVGTRIAALAPLADPGVVIVDEEHDPAYKSDRTPRYQARDVALELGRLAGAPVVLGSATPDVASCGRARAGKIEHADLPRVAGAAPDRRGGRPARGARGGQSGPAVAARLAGALEALDTAAGDQAILVINRRGSASVVVCRDCGYVQICPECQRPLVFHANTLSLRCHHCGATAPVARRCPACELAADPLPGRRHGARRARGRHPLSRLRVARLDRDVVERKGEARVVVDVSAPATSTCWSAPLVAKGLDVPQVTLVGVVSADIALNLPDERAAERTYQLLAQAIGRAGRGEKPGRAIIQTYFARPSSDPRGRERQRGRVLRERAGIAPALPLAAVR